MVTQYTHSDSLAPQQVKSHLAGSIQRARYVKLFVLIIGNIDSAYIKIMRHMEFMVRGDAESALVKLL